MLPLSARSHRPVSGVPGWGRRPRGPLLRGDLARRAVVVSTIGSVIGNHRPRAPMEVSRPRPVEKADDNRFEPLPHSARSLGESCVARCYLRTSQLGNRNRSRGVAARSLRFGESVSAPGPELHAPGADERHLGRMPLLPSRGAGPVRPRHLARGPCCPGRGGVRPHRVRGVPRALQRPRAVCLLPTPTDGTRSRRPRSLGAGVRMLRRQPRAVATSHPTAARATRRRAWVPTPAKEQAVPPVIVVWISPRTIR